MSQSNSASGVELDARNPCATTDEQPGFIETSGCKDLTGADMSYPRYLLDDWLVEVGLHQIKRGGETIVLEPLPMAVLATLCRLVGEPVSAEVLLDTCWPGVVSGDNPVHKVIAGLRRSLGDSATRPRYIETLRRRGYRLIAPIRVVSPEGERSHQGGWRGKSPFCGLEAFGPDRASVFFGRDEEVAILARRLGEQWDEGHPLVLLIGPSGSGKTSLVQAGLLPALLAIAKGATAADPRSPVGACAATCLDLGIHSALGPWRALAAALLDWEVGAVPLLSGYSVESLASTLRARPSEVAHLLRNALAVRPELARAPPLLVLDRFEAMFQAPMRTEADEFIAGLGPLVSESVMLLLVVCRNDFYPDLARYPLLMRGKAHGAHFDLEPPDAEAMAQIVRLPARAADLHYGTEASGLRRLDDRLCADAMQAQDALPLLQHALQALYLAREPGNELTWAAYDEMGGLEGAVGQRAEATLAALPPHRQAALPRLLARLIGLTAEEAAPTSRWVRMSELEGEDERVLVQALVEGRLLVADRQDGVVGVRVSHEALLRRWPRVTNWIGEHRATLAARDELLPWVRRWTDGAGASSLLLPRGTTLWAAADALAKAPHLFGENERRYLARSLSRLRQQVRWRWGASATALLVAIVAGVAAVRYAQLARLAADRELQSQRLASFMLGDLADQLRPIGQLKLLASISQQGLRLLGRPGAAPEAPTDVLQRARALVMIGEVNSSSGMGHLDVAYDALRQAEQLLRPLETAAGVPLDDYYKALGADAFWMAQIAYDANDFERATATMTRYRAICERWLAALPDSEPARVELGYAVSSLGSIAMRRGALAEATKAFEASLALKTDVLRMHPDDAQLLDAAASTRTWLGRLATIQGSPRAGLALLNTAYATKDALRTRYPAEHARAFELGVLDIHRAEALKALGSDGDALRRLQEGVAWLREAVKADRANRRWLAEQFAAESVLLQSQIDAGAASDESWKDLSRRIAELGDAAPGGDHTWRQTAIRMALIRAELIARRHEWPEAIAATAAIGQPLDALTAELPHDPWTFGLKARRALLGIDVLNKTGSSARLRDWCERSAEALLPGVQSGQSGLVLETWLVARRCAGLGDPDTSSLQRLVAGGYRPIALFPKP